MGGGSFDPDFSVLDSATNVLVIGFNFGGEDADHFYAVATPCTSPVPQGFIMVDSTGLIAGRG